MSNGESDGLLEGAVNSSTHNLKQDGVVDTKTWGATAQSAAATDQAAATDSSADPFQLKTGGLTNDEGREHDRHRLEEAVKVLKDIAADIDATVKQLRAAGFSESEQPPAE